MRTKKLISGFKIPVLGIGTYLVGGHKTPDYSEDRKWIKVLKTAISMGYTHFDTAEIYGGGHAEELIGEAIRGIDRKRIFITTKVDPSHLAYDSLIQSAENSLKRLGTKYIDLYLIHFPNDEIPLKETMRAMDYLVDRGMVKNIGVSNFNVVRIKRAARYTRHKIVANEVRFSLWSKDVDLEVIEYCQKNDIMVLAHKPFQRGKINEEKIGLLSGLAKKYGKTEPQVVLNWIISKKNMVALFKSGDVNHIKKNFSFRFRLSQRDADSLDQIVKDNQKR